MLKLKDLVQGYENLLYKTAGCIDCRIPKKLYGASTIALNKTSDEYVTYLTLPKKAGAFTQRRLSKKLEEKIGIIFQGYISDDFILETLKLYKKTMPDSILIVSTWDSLDTALAEKIKKYAYLVLTKDPEYNGTLNINRQVVSTLRGIEKAEQVGCSYVMKTRVDQRFYVADLDNFLVSLIKEFPLGNEFKCARQKKRIIISQGQMGSTLFFPFFASDFMFFGTLSDIKNLFSSVEIEDIKFDEKQRFEWWRKMQKGRTIGEFVFLTSPEIKILYSYAQRFIDSDISYSIKDYWAVVRNSLIFVSNEEVGFFWQKYEKNYKQNNFRMTYDSNPIADRNLYSSGSFMNWLLIKNGNIEYKAEYEKHLKVMAEDYYDEKWRKKNWKIQSSER